MGWLRNHVLDRLWPTVDRPTREEAVGEAAARTARRDSLMLTLRSFSTPERVQAARESIERLASDQRSRLAGIEERLRGLVSLAAVAAAITVAIGAAPMGGDGGVAFPSQLLALTLVYAVLQLLAALRAAINGLERRSFRVYRPEDLISGHTEEPKDRELRLAGISFDTMVDLQEAGNRKVEQMSVAYRALKNFVLGLLFAAGVVLIGQFAAY